MPVADNTISQPVVEDSDYPEFVLKSTKYPELSSLTNAFEAGKAIPTSKTGAVVCLAKTATNQFYRFHSTHASNNGYVHMQPDINAFNILQYAQVGDSFVMSLPSDADNPSSSQVPFPGKVYYSGNDGFCIARYELLTPPSDKDYLGLVLEFTEKANEQVTFKGKLQQVYKEASYITPSPTGAIVCVEKTPKGLLRTHSTNAAANGMMTLPHDIHGFSSLFNKPRGHAFTLDLAEPSQFTGVVIYSGTESFCVASHKEKRTS
jgi:hypothetical protein